MKEDLFFKVGYSNYLKENEEKNWTSKLFEKIMEHKVIISIITIILICLVTNFWLVYKFLFILENTAGL